MQMKAHRLKNGIRLVHIPINSKIAHCGFIMNVGTRDEHVKEMGMAHFLEHTIFKGTTGRKAYHILSRIDDVGGELNAFTTKEEINVYASFLKEHMQRSMELLIDIVFHSIFPEKEIEKEKVVVLDEINSYKDSPQDLIFDDIEEYVFKGHPLGNPILGTPKTVRSFTREKLQKFIENNFYTDEIVFSVAVDLPFEKVLKMVEKHLDDITPKLNREARLPVNGYEPLEIIQKKKTYQTHLIIANRAYPNDDDKSNTLVLLNNLLGGLPLNNRLNLNIREKYGFTYNIESFYHSYQDTGLFGIYAGADKGAADKTIELIYKELQKLRESKLGTLQLSKAKNQLKGQLAMSQESNQNLMLGLGKYYLNFNKLHSLQQSLKNIDAITAEQILEVANEIFVPEKMTTLIYKGK